MATKMPWFRLYTEIMDDPKLAAWTGDQFRVLIFLFCLARESDEPGLIKMTPPEIAWRIRQPVELVEEVLQLGMAGERPILVQDDGGYRVLKWNDRQYDYPSDHPAAVAERARKHRSKKKKADPPNSDNNEQVTSASRASNEQVTSASREKNDRDTDTESDTEKEAEAEADTLSLKEGGVGGENFLSVGTGENDSAAAAAAAAAQVFKQELKRSLTPLENEQLAGWLKESSPELVLEALRRAVLQGKPTFRYIGGILQKWQNAGLRTIQAVTEKDPVYGQKVIAMPSRADPGKKDIDEGIRAALAYMRLTVGDPEGLSRAQVDEFFVHNDYGPDVARAVKEKLFGGDPP